MSTGGRIQPLPEEYRTARAHGTTAVVVAGMHRSGTSAITRILNLLGFDLPRMLYAARADNPLGYWEPQAVVDAHDEFLASIGSSFDDVFPLPDATLASGRGRALEDRLVEILRDQFGGSSQFVVKDPRICRLVPIWTAALERFGAEPHFVLTVRNPLEVAASLKVRNEYSSTKSLLLWLRHVLEAERHTRLRPRSVISYEGLLRDWRSTLDRVAFELGLVWPRASHVAHAEIEEFLSPRRRHHSFDPLEVESRDDVVDWVKRTYGALLAAAAGESLEEDVLDAVRAELDRADLVYGPLLAESSLALATRETALGQQKAARESAEAELAERREVVAKLEPELESARRDLEVLRRELTELRRADGARAAELEEARTELERLRPELAARVATLAARETEAQEARAELDRLTAELSARNAALAGHASELQAAREELQRAGADQRASVETLTARESELEHARGELERVRAEVLSREEALAAREAELEHARGELERTRAESVAQAEASRASEWELQQSRAELAARERELSEHSARVVQLEDRLRDLGVELAERSADLEFTRSELDRAASSTHELTRRVAIAETEREEIERALEEREAALESATVALAHVEAELERVTSEGEASRSSIGELARKVELSARTAGLLEEELGRARAELADRTRLVAERDRETGSLRAEFERLGAELAARGAEVNERDSLLEEVRGEIQTLRDEVASRSSELERLTAEGQAQRAEIQSHVSTIASLRAVIEEQAGQLQAQAAQIDAQKQEIERRWWRRSSSTESRRTRRQPRARALLAAPRKRGLYGRWRSWSQLASWLLHPRRGGLRNLRSYLQLRRNELFDAEYYLATYPDVAQARLDPLMHYVEHGEREGRLPSAGMNARKLDQETGEPPAQDHDVRVTEEPTVSPALTPPAPEPAATAVTPAPVPPPNANSAPASKGHAASVATVAAPAPIEPTDISDFTFLLSRQRSGTNAIRSILETHPDVFCFNEVFNFADKNSDDDLLRESNFFTFLERYAAGDIRRTFPDNHERLFLDFLEYLRCLAAKPKLIVDVKYNTAHFLTCPSAEFGVPYLFELLMKHGAGVLNVTRRNYLRYVLSTHKSFYSKQFTVDKSDATYKDSSHSLDPDYVLSELVRCRHEDGVVHRAFGGYRRFLTWDYADIFPGDVPIAPSFLESIATWLDVPQLFRPEPVYRKQSTLTLDKTLENYDEISTLLRDSEFAYCLDDEPVYGSSTRHTDGTAFTPPASIDWCEVIGAAPDKFCDDVSRNAPSWVQGSISFDDARFLFRQALEHGGDLMVEIGTASGVSTAILGHAANFRGLAGLTESSWTVVSVDIQRDVYFDKARRVGDAAREVLPSPILARLQFRNPATALDIGRTYGRDEIGFLFIDANHKHPWPALDLLATLDVLAPGAVVVCHDINLPLLHPEFAAWGVKILFDELVVEKETSDVELPNIGSIRVPRDKESLRRQLVQIVAAHEWEVTVPEDVVAALVPESAVRQPVRL